MSYGGSGNSHREFLHVDDLANAVVWILQNYTQSQFLNIGTGEDVSIKELAELIQTIIGFEGSLVFDETKPDGMPKKLLDVTKLHEAGWKHTTDLRSELEQTYKWYRENFTDLLTL